MSNYKENTVFPNPALPEDSKVTIVNYPHDFRKLPLNPYELRRIESSILTEDDIQKWQDVLKRKLTFDELNILFTLADHGIRLEETDFKRIF